MNRRDARRNGYHDGLSIAKRLPYSTLTEVMTRDSGPLIERQLQRFEGTLKHLTESRAMVLSLAYHVGLVAGVSAGVRERRNDNA